MTTATPNGQSKIDHANKTAVCEIFIGSDYSQVTSPTGTAMVAMVGEDSDWGKLTDDVVKLLVKLRDTTSTSVTLTFAELRLFKALSQQFPDPTPSLPTPNAVAPAAPAISNPPIAPAVPTPSVHQETTSPVQPTVAPVAPVSVPSAPETEANQEPETEEMEPVAVESELDAALRRREHLMRSLRSISQDKSRLFRCVYYIPNAVSNPPEGSERVAMFYDLSVKMRRAGMVQFDGSTYYGKEENRPDEVFSEMDEWNKRPEIAATEFLPKRRRLLVRYRWEEIHPDEREKSRHEAFQALLDNTLEVQESMLESIDNASTKLDEAMAALEKEKEEGKEGPTHNKVWKLNKARIASVASAVSAARGRLRDAIRAAELFDETESLADLFTGVRNAIQAHQTALEAMRRLHKQQ